MCRGVNSRDTNDTQRGMPTTQPYLPEKSEERLRHMPIDIMVKVANEATATWILNVCQCNNYNVFRNG